MENMRVHITREWYDRFFEGIKDGDYIKIASRDEIMRRKRELKTFRLGFTDAMFECCGKIYRVEILSPLYDDIPGVGIRTESGDWNISPEMIDTDFGVRETPHESLTATMICKHSTGESKASHLIKIRARLEKDNTNTYKGNCC